LTRVGQVDANLSGAGLRIGWLLRHQAPILRSNAIPMRTFRKYVSSLSAHGGRLHRDVCVSVLLEDFATFMTFLPALVGAGSGNRNLRRQISARSTVTRVLTKAA
jgi:hypothetical protein